MNSRARADRAGGVNPNLLGRKEINAIERGDDFTAHQQLLQIVAIAQRFVLEEVTPKIGPENIGLP